MKTSSPKSFSRRAFTLIELLIVVAIIAILVAVSLTAFNGIKKKAARTAAVATMRTIGQSLEIYVGDNDGYYPPGGGGDVQMAAKQSASLADPAMLAYYIEELIDTDETDDAEDQRKILNEIVPKSVLPFLQDGDGNENRELYFLYHVDIDQIDPKPGSGALNPGNSPWGSKSVAIGFPRAQVPMISDLYLSDAWKDYKTEDKQTFWGNTFNVHYWDGSVATLREDDFEWVEALGSGG